ncbi:MAG TPA: IclR family transcriptional regulator [Bryobacteraceae bacterium]|nr:IclR family transcriptional regulator [Bryobacteraceae bacterium]
MKRGAILNSTMPEQATAQRKRSKSRVGPDPRYLVPVVNSTLKILEELSREGSLSLNEVTVKTGIAKSTVFRILTTLVFNGYVLRNAREYYVSPKLGSLANSTATVEGLKAAALPYMLKLRDKFGETVNLGQLSLDKVVYLEVVPSEYALRFSERAGASAPAHATALGKTILAFSPSELVDSLVTNRELTRFTPNTITDPEELRKELRRVRERGYALDKGEVTTLASCVAAPVLDAHGVAVAGLSISGPTSRFNPKKNERVVGELVTAARAISRNLVRVSSPRAR